MIVVLLLVMDAMPIAMLKTVTNAQVVAIMHQIVALKSSEMDLSTEMKNAMMAMTLAAMGKD
jgi:hypothetical protein